MRPALSMQSTRRIAEHERNEYRHHTIAGKVDSKIDEAHNEAVGATNAIERAHERHEAVEHSEGRD